MFSFIKVAISTLFGGGGATSDALTFAQKAATGVGSWIDEQKFTEEEAAQMRLDTGKMMLDAVKATQGENTVRSITRRYLAWAITAYTLLWASVAMICVMMGMDGMVSGMLRVVKEFYLGEGFVGVIGFYFLSGIVRTTRKQ